MSLFVRRIEAGTIDPGFWPALAEQVAAWCADQGLASLRDTVLLLPHSGVLADARAAFARRGGWQPRIETAHTLAASLAPPAAADDEGPSFDAATDRLQAAALLQRVGAWQAWFERDPRAFDAAVDGFVSTAQAMARAAQAIAPSARDAWWQRLREALPPLHGPGATERALTRAALEWAALARTPAIDALWSLRASAWVVIEAAGGDALGARLAEHAAAQGIPVLRCETDPAAPEAWFDDAARLRLPTLRHAHQLEDEAQAAALAVIEAVDAGHAPVALVAQDRLVVRRIRALLERTGLAIADETGWTLSTTRAAARLMAWLRAAAPQAGRDAWLDALKAESADEAPALVALELAWRREREPEGAAREWLDATGRRLQLLRGRGPRSLAQWLAALREASPATIDALAADEAGRAVLAALHLASPAPRATLSMNLDAFTAWIARTLEDASYVPAPPADAIVVITPLARAVLRPFAAVVMPGCDEQHFGGHAPLPAWVPDAVARSFGLPDAAQRREREGLAFAHLLRAPRLTLLRRTQHDGEALAPSPWLELAWHARRRLGEPLPEDERARLPQTRVPLAPLARPAPSMAGALPERLSASSAEMLRACPYQFFARVGLGLGEPIELDAELDKSDHGRWLHAVLHAFHEARDGADDRALLLRTATQVQDEHGLTDAALLPFRAAFETFADAYLDWLHARERDGWRYAGGELARRVAPPELGGIVLDGRIDRLDRHDGDGAAMLVDYKTGNADALAKKVREPLEDTQLAFYAALLTPDETGETPPRAIYLALDDRREPRAIEHPDVALSASLLIDGLAADLDALRQGQGAAALGEGQVCEHCPARGLCRRDHWSAPS